MAENIVYSDAITMDVLDYDRSGGGKFSTTKKYYKVKVTDTGRKESSDKTGDANIGRPILTYEIHRYDSAAAAETGTDKDGVVIATKSSERGSRFAFTSNADIDEKFSQGDILNQLKPALDDAGKRMLLTGANNARLVESFKELGSGDLTAVNDSINQDGGDSLGASLAALEGFRSPTKVLSTQAIKYPLDLRNEDQDVLKVIIKERKPRRLQGGTQAARDQSGVTAATIFLPITGVVKDTTQVDYSDSSLNFAEAAFLEFSRTLLTNKDGETEKTTLGGLTEDLLGNLNNNTKALQDLVGSKVTASALGAFNSRVTGNQILSRQTGLTMNPNLELLFKSPTLRNFRFQYKFSPRSAPEGRVVKQIINFFKRSMVPKKNNGGGFFLTSPDVFMLQYLHKGQPHTSLNRFKTCALKTCNVNYAPDGTYATFPDGVMHSYVMTLGFTEIDPVFSEDYGATDEELGRFLFAPTFEEMGAGGSSGQEIGF